MKLALAISAALACSLMAFPMLFASGDAPSPQGGCAPLGPIDPMLAEIGAILATIRERESGGDYQARSTGSTASGAYQFIDGTWAGYAGYARAWLAPPEVQDAKAAENVRDILDANDGDVTAVPVVWYIGFVPAASDPAWDKVPGSPGSNRLTPRQYQTAWLDAYQQQLATDRATTTVVPTEGNPASTVGSCTAAAPGTSGGTVIDRAWAYPAPHSLFLTATVSNPHHDYPAWDWGIAEGTPIFAVHGGTVVSVSEWNDNTLDHPCTSGQVCSPCGVGLTIEDATGTRWTYCHGSQLHVAVGDAVEAGRQILSSGNTGRSTGPHLHLAIRTADGQRRCPQPLLETMRDRGTGVDPTDLPTSGCTY